MELQFYGPGSVPQFEGFGCTAHQYCAAMTIDSFVSNQNTGVNNTSACNNYILGGVEPVNWAYITKSGVSQGPANPLFTGTFANPNFTAVNPNLSKDLFMSPGDTIRIHLHDTPAGLRADLTDLTTGQHGSMTASIANGFGHILYTPNSGTCQEAPYAFHPEYSTANPRGNTWSLHTYNVAMSDEIGHFENCLAIDANGNCTSAGAQDGTLDSDDTGCLPGTDSSLVMINECTAPDEDWDGQSYRLDWPGTNPNPAKDRALHPTPVLFTSPLTRGKNYSTVAFETDLPGIEVQGAQANPPFCDVNTGDNCVNPPAGAAFYPFFSTTGGAAPSAVALPHAASPIRAVAAIRTCAPRAAMRASFRPPLDGPQPDTVPAGHASHSALASCPADAVAPAAGGIHSDEVRRYPLDPRLKPGIDERRALGLGIQMVRRSPYQHEPPLTRFHIDLVRFHRDLILGLCDTSPQVLVEEDGIPRPQDNRPLVDRVRDGQRRRPVPAVVDQAPEPAAGEQLQGFGLTQALQPPGTRSRARRRRTAGRTQVGVIIRHSSTP